MLCLTLSKEELGQQRRQEGVILATDYCGGFSFQDLGESLEIVIKGFTMAKMRHMYGTKVPNFIGL